MPQRTAPGGDPGAGTPGTLCRGARRGSHGLRLRGPPPPPSTDLPQWPSPRRPAPRTTSDTELATGRFILLHDPDGSAVWDGEFRIVTYIRAQLEPEMGNDEMLGTVAWTWLVEALENHKAPYRAAGGTATRVLSESFGTLADTARVHRHRTARVLDPGVVRTSRRTWKRGPTWSARSPACRRCRTASRPCRNGAGTDPQPCGIPEPARCR